ncbi:dihydrofolate reductase family protein [Spirillospora sp. NPDC029432]|uniref:dihydrofolate reductase family protein n=1 Tax=Spirillospora sp. NPDC029432 TaxID=3154599 RepID=UPI0034556149
MRKLTVTAFVSVDGVMQGPGAPEEDTDGDFRFGGWTVPHFDDEVGRFVSGTFERATGFVLGRRTYEIFAAYWPHHRGDPVADGLNTLPKYVASRTLGSVGWEGAVLLEGDAADAVRELKEAGDGELQVHGSAGLVQSLHPLVDEYNLIVFPVVLGTGKRLFENGAAPGELSLAGATTTGSVTINVYRREGDVPQGTFLDP